MDIPREEGGVSDVVGFEEAGGPPFQADSEPAVRGHAMSHRFEVGGMVGRVFVAVGQRRNVVGMVV